MKKLLLSSVAAIAMLLSSPEAVLTLSFEANSAEAQRGGFRGPAQKPAMSRPRPQTRPSINRPRPFPSARPRPSINRPITRPRPSLRPSRPISRPRPTIRPNRPNRPDANRPTNGRPPAWNKPNRPNRPGTGMPGNGRPPAWNKPNRPNGPGIGRPPNGRPPAWNKPNRPNKPGAGRPPGWRPPHWRPPNWRPPFFRPPYYRPWHSLWGRPYWFPRLGWYHSYPTRGSTMLIVEELPRDCDSVYSDDETLYQCDAILYRETYLRGRLVYEVITDLDDLR
jgi:hypothetical protein